MSKLITFPGGLLLGAGLMYFLDPARGRGRRRRLREALQHAERVERELFGKAARDTRQRVHGVVERLSHPPARDVSDEVIDQRLRARLGRAVSHPRALDFAVVAGRVVMRGHVIANEADDVIKEARDVPGVREVVDRLERHASPEGIPSLQGPPRRRRARGTWPPAAQAGATSVGAVMLAYGLVLKRGIFGALLGTAGGALALRGSANKPLPDLFSSHSPITVQKSITVNKPINDVFDCWSRFDSFPQFMQHVQEVDLQVGGNRSRWTVDGPAGTKLHFEAETIDFEPDRVIAWRTLPKQPIEHEGRVRFIDLGGDRTRVTVQMTYRPPGGVVGHAIAHLLGWDPKARMDDDLVRMKTLLEEGKTRAHQQSVELADLH